MISNLQQAETITDTIYALEPIAYYCGIVPKDFWNSRYKEIHLYCEMQFLRNIEDYKQNIILQEAVTDKMIQADSMGEKPKIVPLRNMFKELFKKK